MAASEQKLNKIFDQNVEITGTLTVNGTVADLSNYLTSFTETDPTVPSHVKSITTTNIANWNTAYGWGNHADAGYLTSVPAVNLQNVTDNGATTTRSITIADNAESFTALTLETSSTSYVKQDFKTDTIAASTTYLIAYGSGNASDGSLAIKNNASHTTTNGTEGDIWFATGAASTERLRIDGGTGDVRIVNDLIVNSSIAVNQTTSPSQALHVNGNIIVGGQTNGFIHGGGRLAVSADGDVIIVTDSNDTSGATPDGKIVFGGGSLIDTNADQSFSFDDAFGVGVPRNEWARLIEGKFGIGETDPDTKLHITEEGAAPVLLTLQNTTGDILNDGTTGNFIDFISTDANANFTPQVRIGMVVEDYSGDGGIPSEGVGNFVVYTGQGTDDLGNGVLTETFRVREDNGIQIHGTTNDIILSELSDGTWHLRDTFQDNGIKIYSTSGGMDFQYNGVTEMSINGSGVVFTGTIDLSNANLNIGSADIVFGTVSTNANRGLVWDVDGSYLSKLVSGGTNGGMVEIYTNMDDGITGDVFRVKTGSTAATPFLIKNSGNSYFAGDLWMDFSSGTVSNSIIFRGASDSGGEVGIRANGESFEIYEPEDTSKVWLTIADDPAGNDTALQVNSAGGMTSVLTNWNKGSFINKAYIDGLNVDADTLDSLNSTQFLRSDTSDTMDGTLTVNSILVSATAPLLDFVDTNSFADPNDRFRIRAAGDVGQIRWWDDSASTDSVLATFYPDGDLGISGDVSVTGGRVTIVEDAGNRPKLAFQETPDTDSFILEYNGVGGGAGNYVSFYSPVSGWAGLGQGLNYIPENGRVGIGETSPSFPLHVSGKIYSTTEVQGGAATMRSYGGYAFFGSNSSAVPLAFGRDGTSYDLTINGSGHVGVGMTSATYPFEVATANFDTGMRIVQDGGTGYAPASILLEARQSTSRGSGIYHYNTQQDTSWYSGTFYNNTNLWGIAVKTSETTWNPDVAQTTHAKFVVDTNGNVGIGTNNLTTNALINELHIDKPVANGVSRIKLSSSVEGKEGIIGYSGYLGEDYLYFNVGNTDASTKKMVISDAGFVGIGTDQPLDMLHLKSTGDVQIRLEADTDNVGEDDNPSILLVQDGGAVSGRFNMSADNALELINQYDGAVRIGQNNSPNFTIDNTGKFAFGSALSTASHFMQLYDDTPWLCMTNTAETLHGIRFEDAQAVSTQNALFGFNCATNHIEMWINNTKRFQFNSDGNFHVDGDVIAYSSTTSDVRLKDNIKNIDNALNKVLLMRGVEYVWNNGSRKGQKDLGVIAQEMEQVIPDIVREHEIPLMDNSGKKYKTVDYEKLTAVLIEAVKELSNKVEELENKLNGSIRTEA